MSRPLRIQYTDAWYHVMNRGRRGEKVFEAKADYWSFIDLLEELNEVFNVKVAAYCLMPNLPWSSFILGLIFFRLKNRFIF